MPVPSATPPSRRFRRWLALVAASICGAALVAAVGWTLVAGSHATGTEHRADRMPTAFGDAVARLSYDLLYQFRGPGEIPDACIVYLDERSSAKLGQKGGKWHRGLHTQLVQRLTRDGARAVFFDIVFHEADDDPAVDEGLAAALRENGHVFLGAALEPDYGAKALQERVEPPTPVLRQAAAGWGLIAFRPIDPDYGVRRIYAGRGLVPSASWRAAASLGASLPDTEEGRAQERWLNYYGPVDSFPSVGYDRALSADELPPGFFKDRLVFIGGRSTLATLLLGKDDFRTPYGLFGHQFAKGVEIHLTTLLNLLRGEWLTRLAPAHELWVALLAGLLLGGGLPWMRPTAAAVASLLWVLAFIFTVLVLHQRDRLWLAWLVPGAIQPALALGWAIGARYFVEERRRRRLHDAFGRYLSPQMAARIADADVDLKPGGRVLTATVMFTDLEDYSGLCERLDQPDRIARVLNSYYTRTISHILESDGTVIKYMGDSVEAVWGAPLPDADQVRKAVRAAWRLHIASRETCDGHSLRTRIGLNRGEVLAGNLGAAERFDFAVIGSPVNLASRFEGLNKHLGTDILLSEAVRAELRGEYATRALGRFRVVGNPHPQTLHELLGPADEVDAGPWLPAFAAALTHLQTGDIAAATHGFQEADRLRPSGDGPSQFFLERIATHTKTGNLTKWDGIIAMTGK